MKAIELTKEQQGKLLEMCKALFPEYNKFWFSPVKGDTFIIEASISGNLTLIPTLRIHWFEFCMTHLVSKIFPDYKDKAQFIIDTWNSNPIDYLYEQFKKLTAKDDRIEKIVFKLIEGVLGKEERTLNEKLSELGLDSLDEVELIMDLEKTLGIFIPDEDVDTKIFKSGNTIQHLVDYVKSKL